MKSVYSQLGQVIWDNRLNHDGTNKNLYEAPQAEVLTLRYRGGGYGSQEGTLEYTANKGYSAIYTIGKSRDNYTCGTVKIGDNIYYDGSSFQNGGDIYLADSPFIYQP